MPTTLERLQYGFDRDSRRTWRRRTLTTGEDNAYTYDGLSQVVQDARGNLNLNQTAISAVPVSQQNWDYDPTGNWRGYETQANGSATLVQQRVHDKGNRLMQIEGDPNPILVDRAGRMRQVPPDAAGDWNESLELSWDAWGRITQVKKLGEEEVLGSYAYDGLGQRITSEVEEVVQHSYYSDSWRPLEERKGTDTDAAVQYLWGVRHPDDLVRRDRDVDDDGDLDETRYVLMDYFNPASIVDETGAVMERYTYTAFGIRSILAPDFSPRSASESAWRFTFQGQFLDEESGLLNYGYRYYSPFLGRWTRKDPIEEAGSWNVYMFVGNAGINQVDLYGLSPTGVNPPGSEYPDKISELCDMEKKKKEDEEKAMKALKDQLKKMRQKLQEELDKRYPPEPIPPIKPELPPPLPYEPPTNPPKIPLPIPPPIPIPEPKPPSMTPIPMPGRPPGPTEPIPPAPFPGDTPSPPRPTPPPLP